MVLIQPESAYRFPYRHTKLSLDLPSQETIFLLITITLSVNIEIDKFVYLPDLETTILAYLFSLQKLELHGNRFILTKIVNLKHREIHHLYKNWYYVAKTCEIIESNYNVYAFTPDCGYDNSTNTLNGGVYCPNTKCLGKLFLHKGLFILLAEAIINVRTVGLCARCATFFWRSNKLLFLVAGSKGLHFWREPKINSRCYWRYLMSWRVLFQQRELRISWWLCNNSEIYLCLWKMWSLIVCPQCSFFVTRARKDDKNRQNTFFLC